MMARPGMIVAAIAAAAGSVFLACSSLTDAGGSEIGNPSQIKVMGSVVYGGSGMPVAGADVRIRSKTFCKDTTMAAISKSAKLQKNTITDVFGRFTIDSVDTGDYLIEVNDGKLNAAAISCAARGASRIKELSVHALLPTATIRGLVARERSDDEVYVQMYGLDRVARADLATGEFVLREVPEGTYDLRILSLSPAFSPVKVRQVSVASGVGTVIDTVRLVPFAGWKYSKRIVLNTSVSGANVGGTVYGFPVLVRLSPPAFDFSQAFPDGRDVRFAKADSTPQSFEIERWDPVTGLADVWVRVDTVKGSDSTQSMMVFWGNPEAEGSSNGGAVFGVDNGFIGAWHLDTACTDATDNHHDGTNFGAENVTGIIGNAKKFDGEDSIRIAGLLGQPAGLTLSGWVMTDTTVPSGQDIVSLGDAVLIRADEVVNGYGTGGYAHQYTRNGDTAFLKVTSGVTVAKTGWRHIAFSFDSATQAHSLYIDGVPVRVDNSANAVDYAGVGVNTFIGAHGNGKLSYNNRGCIDEVRVCAVARSGNWIRLCYMNQRLDDKLIGFK
jgi:hypothetical protein